MHLDNIIKKLFWNSDKNTSNSNYRKFVQKKTKYNNILNYLLNRFNDSESTSESLQRIVFNIENRPVCPVCGNYCKFIAVYFKFLAKLYIKDGIRHNFFNTQKSTRTRV